MLRHNSFNRYELFNVGLLMVCLSMPAILYGQVGTPYSALRNSGSVVLFEKEFRIQGVIQAKLGTWESRLKPLYDIENQHVYSYINENDGANNFSLVITDLYDAVNAYRSNLSTEATKQALDFDRNRGNYAPLIQMFMVQFHPWEKEFDKRRDTCLAFRRLGQVKGTPLPIGYEEEIRHANVSFTLTIVDYELDEKWIDFQPDPPRRFGYKWIEIRFRAEAISTD